MNLLNAQSARLTLFILGGTTVLSLAHAFGDAPSAPLNMAPPNRGTIYGTLIISDASAQKYLDARQLAALGDLKDKYRFDSKITGIGPNVYFLPGKDDRQKHGDQELTPFEKIPNEQRPVLPKFDAERL
jgi:hypothetical protein